MTREQRPATGEAAIHGYRLRAYPDARQVRVLESWQRAYAAVWNTALEQRKLIWHLYRQSVAAAEQSREMPGLRSAEPLVAAAPAQVTNEALRRLDGAYRAAFRRIREGRPAGFPRFLSWRNAPLIFSADMHSMLSANLDGTPSRTSGTWRIERIDGRWLRLGFAAPRNGRRIGTLSVLCHRPFPEPAQVRTLALTHKAGHWHASIQIRANYRREAGTGEIGINRGVAVWVATSSGELLDLGGAYEVRAQRIVALQREISSLAPGFEGSPAPIDPQFSPKRRGRGSRAKLRAHRIRKLNREWEAVAAMRRQRAHVVANRLLASHSVIAVEDYDTKRMLEDPLPGEPAARVRHLHRRIADAAWADFANILRYKAAEAGVQIIIVPAAGISTTCCMCDAEIGAEASEAVRSSDRHLTCSSCGLTEHVDVLAARNVLRRARAEVLA